jgi:hypothetical protein
MNSISIVQKLYSDRIRRDTKQMMDQWREPMRETRQRTKNQLENWTDSEKPSLLLGRTEWGESVQLPWSLLCSHGLCVGATGTGKSYAALILLNSVLDHFFHQSSPGMGILDAKGELFQRARSYVYAFLYRLNEKQREQAAKKIVAFDFSDSEHITPFNILAHRGEDIDFLVNDRLETIAELFPGSMGLSPRMKNVLKYLLTLLAEAKLPITALDALLNNPQALNEVVRRSSNQKLKAYFYRRFSFESRSTIAAVWQRIDSLFVSKGVRLSLSTAGAPDFARLQDEGCLALVNTSGAHISRSASEFLLRIILSDLRQSIFRRKRPDKPYLWCADEAQVFYRAPQSRENINDFLTLSRSFGSFLILMTQSLTSAVRDKDILNSIQTNVGWVLMFRATRKDAEMLTPAIDLTCMATKHRGGKTPYKKNEQMTTTQELKARLAEFEQLPPRHGFLWLKSHLDAAFKIKTADVMPPHKMAGCSEKEFEDFCLKFPLSNQIPRQQVENQVEEMHRKMHVDEPVEKSASAADSGQTANLINQLKKSYASKQGGEL